MDTTSTAVGLREDRNGSARIPTEPTPAVGAEVHDLGWGVIELNPLTQEERDDAMVELVVLLLEERAARKLRLERQKQKDQGQQSRA
jgi:hypothetical protein